MSDYSAFLASKRCAEPMNAEDTLGPSLNEFNDEHEVTAPMAYVYGLHDPRTGELRYIGKSDDPRYRLIGQLNEDRGTHRCNWIRSLRREGLRPVQVIIDAVPARTDWQTIERAYIAAARRDGHQLTNGTDGGEGVCGLAPETRERLRRASIGRRHSAETRRKMSAAKKGRPQPEVWKQKMREICAGRPMSPQLCEANRQRMQKLTPGQVREIRRRLAAGESQTSIAPDYGVSNGAISNIATGRTYGDVE